MQIKYIFTFDDGAQEVFGLEFYPSWERKLPDEETAPPPWTSLEFKKCRNCPLAEADHPRCPAALSLVDFSRRLGKIVSFEKVELAVLNEERWVGQNTTAQRAMSSLMGLLLATSGCPVTAFMRPMARFHLPLSNDIETTYRAVGMYLVGQYIRAKTFGDAELELTGLIKIYEDLHDVNASIAQRLKASGEVTEVNSLAMLDLFAQGVPCSIEDSLPEFHGFFAAYTTQDQRV